MKLQRKRRNSVARSPITRNLAAAYVVTRRASVPRMVSSGKTLRVAHSEAFYEVMPQSAAYAYVARFINPGNNAVFPWLSDIAMCYEKYRFRKLVFKYQARTSASYSGTCGLSVDFDVLDNPPRNFLEFCNTADNASDSLWHSFELPVDLSSDREIARFTRQGTPVGTADYKTYDLGNLFIAWVGSSVVGAVVGQIVVDYVVDLYTPQVQDPVGGELYSSDAALNPNDLVGPADKQLKNGHTVSPVKVVGGMLEFIQDFQGIVTNNVTGAGITDHHLSATPSASHELFKAIDAAGTWAHSGWAVDAKVGDQIGTHVNAGSTNLGSAFRFAKAAYDSLSS